jgi:dTMP kinase
MRKKGFFICLEGLDGCGKTTQAKLLAERLKKTYRAVYTAEPSNGKIGRFIKQYCLNAEKRLPSIVEALLFAADRFEHVENEVLPAINQGRLVISDRYVYSSLAYQGATGVDLAWIEKVNEYAIHPDLAVFIDVLPKVAARRLKPKRSIMENLETQRRVRQVYLRFVKEGKLILIDGNASEKKVADDILKVVLVFLGKTR